MIPPQALENAPFSFDLWTEGSYPFTYAEFDPPEVVDEDWYNCGMLRYELVDAQTGETIDVNAFNLITSDPSELVLFGQPPSQDPWFTNSPFEFKIKVTLGAKPDLTVFSDPFEIIVNDSCSATDFDSN